MLIYVKKNFSPLNSYKMFLSNYVYTCFNLFLNFFIIYNLFFFKIIFNFTRMFDYFNFFNIFFKNKLYIFTQLQKTLMRKYSFNRFVVRYTDYTLITLTKQNVFYLQHSLCWKKFAFKIKVIYFRKLNFLKFDNFFFYLLYWSPLHVINYYNLLTPTFGYKSNFLHQLHHVWVHTKLYITLFKYHL